MSGFPPMKLGMLGLLLFCMTEAADAADPPRPEPDRAAARLDDGVVVLDLPDHRIEADPRRIQSPRADSPRHIVIDFWASYCAPCFSQFGHLAELDARADVEVITVGIDGPALFRPSEASTPQQQELIAGHLRTAKEAGLPLLAGELEPEVLAVYLLFQELVTGVTEFMPLTEAMKLSGTPSVTLPTTVVLDARGRVVEVLQGADSARLDALLGVAPKDRPAMNDRQ